MMHNKITIILLSNTMRFTTEKCKYALHKTFSVYLLTASRPSGWKSWIVAIIQLCVTNTDKQDACDEYFSKNQSISVYWYMSLTAAATATTCFLFSCRHSELNVSQVIKGLEQTAGIAKMRFSSNSFNSKYQLVTLHVHLTKYKAKAKPMS